VSLTNTQYHEGYVKAELYPRLGMENHSSASKMES